MQRLTSLSYMEKLKVEMLVESYQEPNKRKTDIEGFRLDLDYNYENICAYVNDFLREVVVCIRGTANFSDVIQDFKLIAQTLTKSIRLVDNSERFKKLVEIVKDIYYKYNTKNYNISLTGHSLGGYEVIRLETLFPDLASNNTSFNAGSVPFTKEKIPIDVTHISNPRDIIALGWRNDKQTFNYTNKNISLNPLKNHTVSYFID